MRVAVVDDTGPEVDPYALAARDGEGCLRFLLGHRTGEGDRVLDLVYAADLDLAAWRILQRFGMLVRPCRLGFTVAIATAHPRLTQLFAESVWIGSWSDALLTLPQCGRGPRFCFGRHYSPSVLVPVERFGLPEAAPASFPRGAA